ncbi:MAG: sensor histidine kinase [Bacteroidota bacterium]
MTQQRRTIFIHILGCLVFLSLPVLFSPDLGNTPHMINIRPFQRDLLTAVLLLLFFYANYYVFIPQFFVTKRFFMFSAVVLVCFAASIFIPELLLMGHQHHHHPMDEHHNFNPPPRKMGALFFLSHRGLNFLIVFVLSLLMKTRERLKQTETEKANAELSYLKAQINPHFLFNTLNSIYSLAIQKNDRTADAVVKLSDMMRYVLNDSNTNFVLLEKEINYITSYIELQRMRLASNVQLSYACEGNVADKKIAPLVLIPFIENAFKHGVNSEENSNIDIKIVVTDIHLKMSVKNNCVTTNNNTLNKSGLGIENTIARLKLLYPKNYTLNISEVDKTFTVSLTLNIHD